MPQEYPTINLAPGSQGEDVTKLQKFLIGQGFDIPLLSQGKTEYGYFGDQTKSALAAFQKARNIPNIPADQFGFFGPITLGFLQSQAQKPPTSSNGIAPEDLPRALEGGALPTEPTAPIVQSTEKERAEERLKAIQDSLKTVFGEPPATKELSEEDKKRLQTARGERDALAVESESILQERLKIDEEFEAFKRESGLGVTEAGRLGAISERGREIQSRLDSLNRRELVVETKLRNRQEVIGELMRIERESYEDAVSSYNSRFTQAMQLYSILDKESDEIQKDAKASLDALEKAYKAQIESGNLSFGDISATQRARLAEYETQAGLPRGSTLAVLQTLRPNEEVLFKDVDSEGNLNLYIKNADGSKSWKRITGFSNVKDSGNVTPSTGFVNSDVESSIREDFASLANESADPINLTDDDKTRIFTQLRRAYSPQEATDEGLRNLIGMGIENEMEVSDISTERAADLWLTDMFIDSIGSSLGLEDIGGFLKSLIPRK